MFSGTNFDGGGGFAAHSVGRDKKRCLPFSHLSGVCFTSHRWVISFGFCWKSLLSGVDYRDLPLRCRLVNVNCCSVSTATTSPTATTATTTTTTTTTASTTTTTNTITTRSACSSSIYYFYSQHYNAADATSTIRFWNGSYSGFPFLHADAEKGGRSSLWFCRVIRQRRNECGAGRLSWRREKCRREGDKSAKWKATRRRSRC